MISTFAGRLLVSTQRPAHPEIPIAQGPIAKRPSRLPKGVRSSGACLGDGHPAWQRGGPGDAWQADAMSISIEDGWASERFLNLRFWPLAEREAGSCGTWPVPINLRIVVFHIDPS